MSTAIKPSEWHAARAQVIGGSEIAALFGCQQPYQMSLFELWHVKAGRVPAPEVEGERVDWGNDLEEAIAKVAARRKSWTITPGTHMRDATTAGLGATLDYRIASDPEESGPGVLEIKNVDWLQHRAKWTDGEPPAHILLQLQHQLAATGYEWGYVAALVGGNRLELYRFEARPKIIAEIRARVTAFWQSVEANKPPPVDGSDGAFRTLAALYPEIAPDEIDLRGSNEFAIACAEAATAAAQRKEAEKIEEAAKARVTALLEGHKTGWDGIWRASVAVTPAKPDRAAQPGEIIKGRKESRRLTIKEVVST